MTARTTVLDLVNAENAHVLALVLGVPLGSRLVTPAVAAALQAVADPPRTTVLCGRELAALRDLVAASDPSVAPVRDALAQAAAAIAREPNESVTDKPSLRFGATRHDYVSLARYAWPDPDAADGLPYRIHDGSVNPDAYGDHFDAERLRRLSDRVSLLAVAAYVLGDHGAGAAAAAAVRTWFLDPDTRQTPSFDHAQVVPGRTGPRGAKLVEARRYVPVCDAVTLLAAAGMIDGADRDAFRAWVADFVDWMDHSPHVSKAVAAENNVGLWVDVVRLVLLRTLERHDEADDLVRTSVVPRLERQVDDEGRLPAELARRHGSDYAAFTMVALAQLHAASEAGSVRVADYSTRAGRAFENAERWFRETLALNELGAAVPVLQRFVELTLGAPRATTATTETADVTALTEGMVLMHALGRDREARVVRRLREEHAAREAELERALEASQRRADALERKLGATVATLSDLRTSTSWRLTAPLRRGGAWAREALQRAAGTRPGGGGALQWLLSRAARSAMRSRRDLRDPLTLLREHVVPAEDALRSAYGASSVAAEEDTFALVRVIGNDLYPRHALGQSRSNVAFILEHEGEIDGLSKAWIVNRIVDPSEEAAIVELLERHAQRYRVIPFVADEYASIGFDHGAAPATAFLASREFAALEPAMQQRFVTALYRVKNCYVMHNNGARNAARAYAHEFAKWALPWDGNTFLRADAAAQLLDAVRERPHLPYAVVPMQRVVDNAALLTDGFDVIPVEEPQLVFRRDAREAFDEGFAYGRRPKIELFWRLGVPGPWDRWGDDPWDRPRNAPSADAGHFAVAGWVARLASGAAHLEQADQVSFRDRGLARQSAVIATIDDLDRRVHARPSLDEGADPGPLLFPAATVAHVRQAPRDLPPIAALEAHAEAALQRGPFSVVDKTTLPPSGEPRDYWHPAPYWWPNPNTRDGRPYVRRDGERVPGTRMEEPSSDRYDRTRLQRLFDDTTALALAGSLFGDDRYHQHAARNVRRWFVDPEASMRPHLRYAQVRLGHNGDEGATTGIIEMKDLYYALDALRHLRTAGAIGDADDAAVRAWLEAYRSWLRDSPQGIGERAAPNNHGTYYDLQVAAIEAYLGDRDALRHTLLRAESRLPQQFDDAGEQPHERDRTISAHYYLFNLQGWLHLCAIGSRYGFVPRRLDVAPFDRLARGIERLFDLADGPWPYEQRVAVDWRRLAPIASFVHRLGAAEYLPDAWRTRSRDAWLADPSVLDPHDGAHPYWNLVWCSDAP